MEKKKEDYNNYPSLTVSLKLLAKAHTYRHTDRLVDSTSLLFLHLICIIISWRKRKRGEEGGR